MSYDAIYPGQPWLDTEGKPIQAHAASVFYENETFYWYGENKEKTKPGNGILHWGVRCYSSKDLYNWKDEGNIIEPDLRDESSPLHPSSKAERPHILYNAGTRQYVCWLKVMDVALGTQTETVLTAERFLGPYRIARTGLRPLGMDGGDFDLVRAYDGKAYYYFERVHTELICADLTEDYTDVTGYYSTHFPLVGPPYVREAPAYFFRRGKHYLFTSGTTGYHPNPSEVAMADTFHGPWRVLGDPHIGDPSRTSFGSQISAVFRHPGKRDLYIAVADRWYRDLEGRDPEAYGDGRAYKAAEYEFAKMFLGDGREEPALRGYAMPERPDTSQSRYVWLPVEFDGDMPRLRWRDSWRVEAFE